MAHFPLSLHFVHPMPLRDPRAHPPALVGCTPSAGFAAGASPGGAKTSFCVPDEPCPAPPAASHVDFALVFRNATTPQLFDLFLALEKAGSCSQQTWFGTGTHSSCSASSQSQEPAAGMKSLLE